MTSKSKRQPDPTRPSQAGGSAGRLSGGIPEKPLREAQREISDEHFQWAKIMPLLLVLAGVFVYLNTLAAPFIFDDDYHIVRNGAIRSLWPILPLLEGSGRRAVGVLTLAINYAIDGDNVVGYHLFNLAIHVAAGLTLWGIIRRSLLLPRWAGRFNENASWLAFAGAMIWLVHPLNTQAVTYTVQRFESLASLFYLLTLYLAIRASQADRSAGWSVAAVLACGLGMATKEIVVTAPLLVMLYDYVFLRAAFKETLRRRWPLYAGLAATWALLVVMGMRDIFPSSAGAAVAQPDASAGFQMTLITPMQYLLSQPGVILGYLRLAFWPDPLVLDYFRLPARGWEQIAPPLIAIAALFLLSLWGLIRKHWAGYLGAWFFLTLAPSSSVIPIADLMVEHRMYLPLTAVVVLVVMSVYAALGRWSASNLTIARHRAAIGAALFAAAVIPLGIRTVVRNHDYRSRIAIWQSVVEARPNNPRAYHNLGYAYYETQETTQAMACYEQALALMPTFADAHNNLGRIFMDQGRYDKAAEYFQAAVRTKPTDPEFHYNLGQVYYRMNRLASAAEALDQAIRLRPGYVNAYNNLGLVRQAQGRLDDAEKAYRRAMELDPQSTDPVNNLGAMLLEQGKDDQAIAVFDGALRRKPADPKLLFNLGNALAKKGRLADACDQFAKAIQSDPDFEPAYTNLGHALEMRKLPEQAIDVYQSALHRGVNSPAIMRVLAWQLATCGNAKLRRGDLALQLAQQADNLTGGRQPLFQDTLAAALAEVGRFDPAASIMQSVMQELSAAGVPATALEPFKNRLELYRAGKPYHQSP